MTRAVLLAGMLALASCGSSNAPAPAADAGAMAAASIKAVADTDAALREAASAPRGQSPLQPSGSAEQTAK